MSVLVHLKKSVAFPRKIGRFFSISKFERKPILVYFEGLLMDDKPQDISQPTEASALTVSQAAETLGVDSFTVLTFIQEGRLNPGRSSSGEIR